MTKIEEVAKAIYDCDPHLNAGEPVKWKELQGPLKTMAIRHAKAAIAAMREPSEKMLEPVTNADGFFKETDPKRAYQLIIDAALEE